MPCIHRLFPCDVFPCAAVTRSNDGGCDCATSQYTTIPPNWLISFSAFMPWWSPRKRPVNWRRYRNVVVKLCCYVQHHLIWSQLHKGTSHRGTVCKYSALDGQLCDLLLQTRDRVAGTKESHFTCIVAGINKRIRFVINLSDTVSCVSILPKQVVITDQLDVKWDTCPCDLFPSLAE